MATTLKSSSLWKKLKIDGSTIFDFFWADFNPNVPDAPSDWDTVSTSWESSFDLSWFAVWNEVCVWTFVLENTSSSNTITISWDMYFQINTWWWWYHPSWYWSDSSSWEAVPNSLYYVYYYVWIDEDEIRPWIEEYRFHIEWSSSDGSTWEVNLPFTVSNLSFDTSLHDSWYLWIEWTHLCYTDWLYGSKWYKHTINYDDWYSWWSGDAWYIWVPSGTTWFIYYTDAYWTVRRTYMADEWYGWNYYPWAEEWYMYVSDGDYTEWYWYLCFIDGNWELRRIMNWKP